MTRIIKKIRVRPIFIQPMVLKATDSDIDIDIDIDTYSDALAIFDINGHTYTFPKVGGIVSLEDPIEYGDHIHIKIYAYQRQPDSETYHPVSLVWNQYDHHIERFNSEVLDIVFVEWDDDEKFSMIEFNSFVEYLRNIENCEESTSYMTSSWIGHMIRYYKEIKT
jgi:hypothetical protein